jgi:putative glutamine amidotransferase
MNSFSPRIAIPEPSAIDPDYSRQSWPVYAKAVEQAGGTAVKIPLGESPAAVAGLIGSCSGVLLPGSSADLDPEKYGEQPSEKCNPKDGMRESADELLLQDAFNLRKPIFGICYGMQSLNVWKSGSLIQDLPTFESKRAGEAKRVDASRKAETNVAAPAVNHRAGREVRDAHPVSIAPGSLLSTLLAPAEDLAHEGDSLGLSVNSSHHQAVAEAGDELRVVAVSPRDGVIEAIEGSSPDQFVLGVQWHPERTCDKSAASQAIFSALVNAARGWSPRPISDSVEEAEKAGS